MMTRFTVSNAKIHETGLILEEVLQECRAADTTHMKIMHALIASTARDARREQSELYGREYDQGKVTYNDIYFQRKSL